MRFRGYGIVHIHRYHGIGVSTFPDCRFFQEIESHTVTVTPFSHLEHETSPDYWANASRWRSDCEYQYQDTVNRPNVIGHRSGLWGIFTLQGSLTLFHIQNMGYKRASVLYFFRLGTTDGVCWYSHIRFLVNHNCGICNGCLDIFF